MNGGDEMIFEHSSTDLNGVDHFASSMATDKRNEKHLVLTHLCIPRGGSTQTVGEKKQDIKGNARGGAPQWPFLTMKNCEDARGVTLHNGRFPTRAWTMKGEEDAVSLLLGFCLAPSLCAVVFAFVLAFALAFPFTLASHLGQPAVLFSRFHAG